MSEATVCTNATVELESALINYENGAHAFIVPSGANAIALVLMAFARPRAKFLIVDTVYDRTRYFCDTIIRSTGTEVIYYPSNIGENIVELIQPETRLIFCESPGSWTFEIQDIPAIARVAHQHNVILIADNSWATPLFCNPLKLGADIVIQSLTKYISGHADLIRGGIVTNEEAYLPVKTQVEAFGMDDWSHQQLSYLALRGLKTLPVRLAHCQASTLQVIKWLEQREEIAEILHPAIPTHQNYHIWKRDFKGSSGLFSFVLHAKYLSKLSDFIRNLKLFNYAYGWGGYQSLIRIAEDRKVIRNYTNVAVNLLLRMSIGLEEPNDLIADLEQAFVQFN